MSTININKLNAIIEREEVQLNSLPEHTLDWYTYKNRVALLEEVKALVKSDKKVAKEAPKVAPVAIPKSPAVIPNASKVRIEEEPKKVHPSKANKEDKA